MVLLKPNTRSNATLRSTAAFLAPLVLGSLSSSILAEPLRVLDSGRISPAPVNYIQPDGVPTEVDPLADLQELEELLRTPVIVPALNQPVEIVGRQESTVGRSAAAVFVVTQEMIRRSGATSVPEVLRMVPGLQVARIDSNKWAISSRGLNNRFANKLLVMIDGRSVYTPLFSGSYHGQAET